MNRILRVPTARGAVRRGVYLPLRQTKPKQQPKIKVVEVQAPPAKNGKKGIAEEITKDVYDTIKGVANDPIFLAFGTIVIVLTMTHAGDIDTGPLAPLFPKESKAAFVVWVRANVAKFFGGVLFSPVLYSAPPEWKWLVVLLVSAWIYLAPVFGMTEYCIQAFMLFLYFRVGRKNTKIAIVLVAVAIYFMGVMTALPTVTTVPKGNRRSEPVWVEKPMARPSWVRDLPDATTPPPVETTTRKSRSIDDVERTLAGVDEDHFPRGFDAVRTLGDGRPIARHLEPQAEPTVEQSPRGIDRALADRFLNRPIGQGTDRTVETDNRIGDDSVGSSKSSEYIRYEGP